MNDILSCILELLESPISEELRKTQIKKLIEALQMSDDGINDEEEEQQGDWLFRMRERLACWIAP